YLYLSFIVSGCIAVGAVALLFDILGWRMMPLSGWVQVAAIVLASYVAGLLCFAAGRWLRMGSQRAQAIRGFDSHFEEVLNGHGLKDVPEITSYLGRTQYRGIWRLYVRLWAEARQTPELSDSVALLNRYWVMAATYDGMAVALLAWVVALVTWAIRSPATTINYVVATAAALILLMMVRACAREAGRYVYYQVEELVAAIAALRGRAGPTTPCT